MRLFIAFELPENIVSELKKAQHTLVEKYRKELKPVSSFHLTLKFLGDVDDPENIMTALSQIKFNRFRTRLSALGFFPDEDYIKVVWAGLQPDNKIKDLQKQVDEAASFVETEKKGRQDFHAHVTLARVRFLKDPDKKDFVKLVRSQKIPELEFEVSSFKLIKSELTPEGPVYEDLAEFSLS